MTILGGVTIQDIQEAVPVTDRTIRYWVNKGLLPQPVKIGLGRARGTVAYYPPETVERARTIYNIRRAGRTEALLKVIRYIGSSQLILQQEADGTWTTIYRPRLFQKEEDSELERV